MPSKRHQTLQHDNVTLILTNVIKQHFVNLEPNEVDNIAHAILALMMPDILVDINITRYKNTYLHY